MISNRTIRELKYSLSHAKMKVVNNSDIDAKLKVIHESVTNICSDPVNTNILYALVDLPGVTHATRVVEIDFNTGVDTISPNVYRTKLVA